MKNSSLSVNFRIWRSTVCQFFDRWGARVFQTDQIGQGWNGKMQNEGNLMPAGVYIYHLTYQRRGEKESKTTNTVTLLR
ncbi:MAG: gliding motility-associated C-terminal domain-containing protein [Saprospiraceae bacterium]|nr:gliding motility-associated C-terminal domain-containing protein [Saprospiraceae bacterium]